MNCILEILSGSFDGERHGGSEFHDVPDHELHLILLQGTYIDVSNRLDEAVQSSLKN